MGETIQPIYHMFDLGFDTEDVKRVSIKQDSDGTHILVITIYTDDDQMVLNPEWEYHIEMRKPDGKLVVDTENIEIKDDKIYITCTAQMLSAPGTSKCELIIYNNNQSLYTNNFYIYVEDDLITGDEIESTNEFNSIVKVLRELQELKNRASGYVQSSSEYKNQAQQSAENSAQYEREIKEILDSLDNYDEQITTLMNQLQSKMTDIDNLKAQVEENVSGIETLLSKLEEMGIGQIQQIMDSITNMYSNIQTVNNNCTAAERSVNTTLSSIQGMNQTAESVLNSINSKYSDFETKMNKITTDMATIQGFIDDISATQAQIDTNIQAIVADKTQADNDAAAIATTKAEIEALLEQIRQEAETGTLGPDPIVISANQPESDAQATDDMWLEPYR